MIAGIAIMVIGTTMMVIGLISFNVPTPPTEVTIYYNGDFALRVNEELVYTSEMECRLTHWARFSIDENGKCFVITP